MCGSIRAVPFPVCPPSLCVKLHKQDARRGRTDTSLYYIQCISHSRLLAIHSIAGCGGGNGEEVDVHRNLHTMYSCPSSLVAECSFVFIVNNVAISVGSDWGCPSGHTFGLAKRELIGTHISTNYIIFIFYVEYEKIKLCKQSNGMFSKSTFRRCPVTVQLAVCK